MCLRQGQFELLSVNHSAWSRSIIGIFFLIFFNMKVCCITSLESLHLGDSEYTEYHFQYIKENQFKLS